VDVEDEEMVVEGCVVVGAEVVDADDDDDDDEDGLEDDDPLPIAVVIGPDSM
jgi:hypothetical protein